MVRVELLEELGPARMRRHLAELEDVDLAPGQEGFALRPAAVLERGREDPTRRTFVVTVAREGREPRAAGIGALQPKDAASVLWPAEERHVVLRGFMVGAYAQGQGVGSAAVAQCVPLARRLFPDAVALVLTVHTHNRAGIRVYERNGFERTGVLVTGRAGQELVMARALNRG